jgi:hypothetical protein
MLDQFGGEPVAGGTFPSLIFQNFITQAHQILENQRAGKKGATGEVTGLVGGPDTSGYDGDGSNATTEENAGGNSKPKSNTNNNDTPRENTPKQPAAQPQEPATVPEQNSGGNADGDAGGAAPGQ